MMSHLSKPRAGHGAGALVPVLTLFIWGCAPGLRYAPGQDLLGRPAHPGPDTLTLRSPAAMAPPPDSIDADLVFIVHEGKARREIAGRLFARPGRCGKLDLYGLPGMLGGAFRWRNADWELAVYDPPRYDSGQGSRVPLPLPGGAEAPYDALFSPLWGSLLPWMPGTPLERDSLRSTVFAGPGEGGTWRVAFDTKTGLPDTLWDASGGWAMNYGQWRKQGERLLPARIQCRQDGVLWLEVAVRAVRDNPAWRRDPFVLRRPKE